MCRSLRQRWAPPAALVNKKKSFTSLEREQKKGRRGGGGREMRKRVKNEALSCPKLQQETRGGEGRGAVRWRVGCSRLFKCAATSPELGQA